MQTILVIYCCMKITIKLNCLQSQAFFTWQPQIREQRAPQLMALVGVSCEFTIKLQWRLDRTEGARWLWAGGLSFSLLVGLRTGFLPLWVIRWKPFCSFALFFSFSDFHLLCDGSYLPIFQIFNFLFSLNLSFLFCFFVFAALGFELRALCLCSYHWDTPPALFFFLWRGFLRWGVANYLPRLASNLNPPNLCLLSS
jgi:hypothetical protein